MSSFRKIKNLAVAVLLLAVVPTQAAVFAPVEDVMTSSFFSLDNDFVRGYVGNNRATFRVSTDTPFDTPGAETIYLDFSNIIAANLGGPVQSAILTMTSVTGNFGGDASTATPFLVSAHGVNANPLTSIFDNTNLTGTISWVNFYSNNILPADSAASTSITGFGTVTFDVTALVNSWVAGTNSNQFIALTGKNDVSGNDFLHGFRNNSDTAANQGFTFLTVTAVPEPTSITALGLALPAFLRRRAR